MRWPDTTASYTIEGLAPLTKADGHYTLSINLAELTSIYGSGAGSSTITWLKDTVAPMSTVLPLPAKETESSFTVTVSAKDSGPDASGVAIDDIYVSDNGGKFKLWTTVPASRPTAVFMGQPGHTYAFKSVAHDLAGNVEKMPRKIEAKTTVSGGRGPKTRVGSAHATPKRLTTVSVEPKGACDCTSRGQVHERRRSRRVHSLTGGDKTLRRRRSHHVT